MAKKNSNSKDRENFYGLSEIQMLDAYKAMLASRLLDDRVEPL